MKLLKTIAMALVTLSMLALIVFLTGCKAHIEVRVTDPITGAANTVVSETSRQQVIQVDGSKVSIITGKVAISDATVQALGANVASVVKRD